MRGSLAVFLLRRGLAASVFVLVVASAAFLLVQLAPGDAATHLELSGSDPNAAAAMRERLGLYRPMPAQFLAWLKGLATLDLGHSVSFERPVAEVVGTRLLNTVKLASVALLLATAVGIPAGVLTAAASRRWARISGGVSVLFLACPPIITALALMLLATRTGWLSTGHGAFALPVLALALPTAAVLERIQSRASAEALAAPGIAAARARGISTPRLIWVHALRQSLAPVLGVYGIVIAAMFSGSVAVETMMTWPGLGDLAVRAVQARDLFLVTGCAAAVAALIAMAQLATDLLRAAIDPRVRDAG